MSPKTPIAQTVVIRLRHLAEHHITIPADAALKVGTLHGVLADVAGYLGMTVQDLLAEILGR